VKTVEMLARFWQTNANHHSHMRSKTAYSLAMFAFVSSSSITWSQKNDVQAATFNVASCAIVGGVGAWVNKSPSQKGGRAFLSGMLKGAAGGLCVYGGKRMIYSFSQTNHGGWAWASKVTHAVGLSLVENAASNRPLLSVWHFHFGFNRLELTIGNSAQLRYRMMPFALGGFIYASTRGRLNFAETLRVGQPVFFSDNLRIPRVDFEPVGLTVANSIMLNENGRDSKVLGHELIHAYQYEERGYLNTYLNQARERWLNKSKLTKTYGQWVYTDANFVLDNLFYYLGSIGNTCYFDNPYEQEANFYSGRLSYRDIEY
jgi:hypothetical protein